MERAMYMSRKYRTCNNNKLLLLLLTIIHLFIQVYGGQCSIVPI